MTTAVEMRKACKCRGTSSGPRPHIIQQRTKEGGTVISAGYAAMVCDVCETPWIEIPAKATDRKCATK